MNKWIYTLSSFVAVILFANPVMALTYEMDGHSIEVDKLGRSSSYYIDSKEYTHSGLIRLKSAELYQASRTSIEQKDSLYLVQFETQILPGYKKQLQSLGIEVLRFVPDHALLVRSENSKIHQVLERPFVKDVFNFGGAYKMSGLSRSLWLQPSAFSQGIYDVLLVNEKDRSQVVEQARDMGLSIVRNRPQGFSLQVYGDLLQLQALASSASVLWIEPAPTKIEEDMDIVHIQGGVKSLTQNTGQYKGQGIVGHVLEGVYKDHLDFATDDYREAPIAIGDETPNSHGQKTFGIIYGSGKGDSTAMGLMPRAQGLYTNNRYVFNKDNRYELTQELIEKHQVMLQTASWGYPTTTQYNARSLEMDKIIFDLDIAITQSQSNRSSKQSRPQAWAKNIISVGAVHHGNNTDFSDDSWSKGGASIGPASDNRIKPDIVSYYDGIHTTGNTKYGKFGGTSAATPIINGHLGIIIEMYTDGIFGNKLQFPKADRFNNRPHASMAKALLINSARQYQFKGLTHDLTRTHQGWGHPNLQGLYDMRGKMLTIDETDVLPALGNTTYTVEVTKDEPQFVATMVYSDPVGVLGADIHRVNNLDLVVTAPDGTAYYGNNGLYVSNFSIAGGESDKINTVENVIIKDPRPGTWTVTVVATEVNQDGHVETEEMDVDYSLVVSGIER